MLIMTRELLTVLSNLTASVSARGSSSASGLRATAVTIFPGRGVHFIPVAYPVCWGQFPSVSSFLFILRSLHIIRILRDVFVDYTIYFLNLA